MSEPSSEAYGHFYANGGAGDDIIELNTPDDTSGTSSEDIDITLRGGKGNDKLNVYEGSDLYDSADILDVGTYYGNIGGYYDGNHILDGGEGDDEVWALHNTGSADGNYGMQRLYGGNGDDILKNAFFVSHGMLLAG